MSMTLAPRSRLLQLIVLWCAATIGVVLVKTFWHEGDAAVLALVDRALRYGLIASLGVALWDLLQLRALQGFTVTRALPNNLALNGWTEVELLITHPLTRRLQLELFDHYPAGAETEHLPCRVALRPGVSSRISYRMRAMKRGLAEFGQTELLLPSPLGLWQLRRLYGEKSQVRVYPDFAAITRYTLLAIDNRTSQLGIKKRPRRGEGLEFHQLRDYREGDSLRQIDWKATARRQQLISREYQDERDQQLFLMIDCGRRMRTQDDQLSHFDHALNSLLLLSYVAVRQGDAVGLMSFGGQRRWLPAQKRGAAVNTILNTVFDLHPTTHASDYTAAARELLGRQRKRSLVVLVTNLRDENSEDLLPALHLLRRRHLVLLANIREEVLDQTLQQPVRDFDEALDYSGCVRYLAERRETQNRLRRSGVLLIDVTPPQLAAQVVNSYLEIKRNRYL